MTDTQDLRQRALARETLLGTFLNMGSSFSAELCGQAGFNWLLIDLEHGAGSEAHLLSELQAVAGTPSTALVRVEEGTRLRIGRALDLGAPGVMVPRVESAEEARTIASYLRYPPDGSRGTALMTRGADFASVKHDGVVAVNETVLGVFQIESPIAVAAAAEMATVDGVDVLFVGPTDLSHAMGIPGRIDEPAFEQALGTVARAAADAGKAAGVLLWDPSQYRRYADLGYTFLGISSDAQLLLGAARSALRATREQVA